MKSSADAGATYINVDYEVLQNGSTYDYLYQVMPSTSVVNGIEDFKVSVNKAFSNPTLLSDTDIAGLGFALGSTLIAGGTVNTVWSITGGISAANVEWTSNPSSNPFLTPGQKSKVIGFSSLIGPTFGGAQASDTSPPSPWDATTAGSAVPTPVPEPTTMIAGALLLLPFGASTLRILRKNRAA
jgi:hypothetical protein